MQASDLRRPPLPPFHAQARLPTVDSAVMHAYHSAAYCCLAEIVMATQTQVKFYTVFLFKEGKSGDLLWNCLVDPSVCEV